MESMRAPSTVFLVEVSTCAGGQGVIDNGRPILVGRSAVAAVACDQTNGDETKAGRTPAGAGDGEIRTMH
jgi:hypothetical protein